MAKIRCIVSIKNNDEIILDNQVFMGIKEENRIIYFEDNIKVVLTLNDTIKLVRSNDEYELELNFNKDKKSSGKYLLKKQNFCLPLDINTDTIIVDNYSLFIKYKINDDVYQVKFNYEVI